MEKLDIETLYHLDMAMKDMIKCAERASKLTREVALKKAIRKVANVLEPPEESAPDGVTLQ